MAIAFLISGGLYLLQLQADVARAAAFATEVALGVFFSWTITRELHPDAPQAAFVALTLAAVGLWLWPMPDLLLLFQVLLVARLLNRSSGIPARPADQLLLLALTAWLLYKGNLMAGVLAVLGFWLNSRLPKPQPVHKFAALLAAALLVLVLVYDLTYINFKELSIHTNILIIVLSTGFALFSRKVKQVNSKADAHDEPLHVERLRTAQLVILLVTTVFSLWYGDQLFRSLVPLWASFGGIFLYDAFQRTGVQSQ